MVLLLGVTRRDSWRLPLHTGLWPAKLLLWGGACAGFFYVGDTALEGWGEAARVFSAIFIVLQVRWIKWRGIEGTAAKCRGHLPRRLLAACLPALLAATPLTATPKRHQKRHHRDAQPPFPPRAAGHHPRFHLCLQ